jgi:outer membrane protein assembly factor BamB
VRLWPVVLIALGAVAWIAWLWLGEATQRQERVVGTLLTAVAAAALLAGWLLLFSGLRWRVRLFALAGVVVVLVGGGSMLRVRGVTGDVIPILAWRWTPRPPDLPGAVAGEAGLVQPATPAPAFPQFLGPRRDGTIEGPILDADWEASPPRSLWRQPIGEGWSGFAVVGPFAVTQEQRGDEEWVSGYELATGRLLWAHRDRARFEDPMGGPGPRATPAVAGGRVYALGATGILNALDLASGRPLWSRDVVEHNGAVVPTYGGCGSPLVSGNLVLVNPGGPNGRSLVAYHADTGERVWSAGEGAAAYSSPFAAEIADTPQVLLLNAEHLAAYALDDGHELWRFPWPAEGEKVSQPLVLPGDRVFQSAGYGVGGKLLQIHDDDAWRAELVWESQALKAKFTNVVHREGHLYGLDDGILACVDLRTGERRWKGGRYGHGQILLVHAHLLVLGETGTVGLVEARPDAFRELARFAALSGKTWNHPALAGAHLVVRNDREAACYALPLAG